MDDSVDLLDAPRPSVCKICCLMCSCFNKKGIWHTKLGKFIFRFPIVLVLAMAGLVLLVLLGISTMKVIYSKYDISTGCPYSYQNCTQVAQSMCHTDDWPTLVIGCAAVGSISFLMLFLSVLLVMIGIGCTFYCFDTCCNEIGNSYKHSRFTLQRSMSNDLSV